MTSVTSPLEAGYLVEAVNPTADTIQSVASATHAGQSSTLPDGATATAVNAAGSTVAVCDGTGFTVDLNFDAGSGRGDRNDGSGVKYSSSVIIVIGSCHQAKLRRSPGRSRRRALG
jgi:hypothetical protein